MSNPITSLDIEISDLNYPGSQPHSDPGSVCIDDPGKTIHNESKESNKMPTRNTLLVTDEVYHVLNRSIQDIPIFARTRESEIFLSALGYYSFASTPIKFSAYRRNPARYKFDNDKKLVTIINYCLMPTHFHLTLSQEYDEGIKTFIQRVTNSFSHFYNIKFKNKGPLFQGNFKAIRVESDEQLMHLSRYIHLNPVTAFIVEKPEDYRFSSYRTYLGREKSEFLDPSLVLGLFGSTKKYGDFVMAQKNYQRELGKIKAHLLENPGS